jgi:hypothetical protein
MPSATNVYVCERLNPARRRQTWKSNTQPGGPAATPVGRGGMGAAAFYKDHFYIFGGEVR